MTLKSGKVVTVMVAKMNGKTMAVIPREDANDIFERAEGHSMWIELTVAAACRAAYKGEVRVLLNVSAFFGLHH